MTVRHAEIPKDLPLVRELFRAYVEELAVDLTFQGFEAELASLPGKYGPPEGCLLLAGDVGCVALRKHEEAVCEMKRLYVRPAGRGTGAGRVLVEKVLEEATALGYQAMVLDTLNRLESALNLYRRLGFEECPPYYENPLPGVVFMRKKL